MAVPDIIPAIFSATKNGRIRTSMAFGSNLESGWSDTATNPSGATGPYQILLPVHPDITFQEAEDPNYATHYMLPAYTAAVAQVPDTVWNQNPEVAAERAVITAEQPGGAFPSGNTPTSYGSEGLSVVNQDWGNVTNTLQGQWAPGSNVTITAQDTADTSNPFANAINTFLEGPLGFLGSGGPAALTKIVNFLSDPVDALERIGLILFGSIIILIGLYVLTGGGGKAGRAITAGGAAGLATRTRTNISGANASRQQQLDLQKQALSIGNRRVAVQEKRQARLSATAQLKAPAIGKHTKS